MNNLNYNPKVFNSNNYSNSYENPSESDNNLDNIIIDYLRAETENEILYFAFGENY